VPVPPLATEITVPVQTPEVIVPTVESDPAVVKPDKVVIAAIDVDEFSIFPAFKLVKLVLMTVLEADNVSLPFIVVIVEPKVWGLTIRSKIPIGIK
jgi:hypothetical protein